MLFQEKWTCIVVTCPYEHWCQPLQSQLGYLPTDLLLIVPDPYDGIKTGGGSSGVGSGGATLNALLVAAEHLSAREGHTTIVSNVLQTSKILIIHLGPSLLPLPMGIIPVSHDSLRTNVDKVVELASMLMKKSSKSGIFVVGTDILIKGSESILPDLSCTLPEDTDICIITVPADKEYASRHGVCKTVNNHVTNIYYQPDIETLDSLFCDDLKVWILSGLVWLSPDAGESLVGLHCMSPLDACTYMGVDSGENILQISFYYDILTSACSQVTQQDFIEGKCGKTLSRGRSASPAMMKARKLVWQSLNKYKVQELKLKEYEGSCYLPITTTLKESEFLHHIKRCQPDIRHENKVVCEYNTNSDNVTFFSNGKAAINRQIKFNFFCDTLKRPLTDIENKILENCNEPVIISYKLLHIDNICFAIFSAADPLFCYYKDCVATCFGLVWPEALKILDLTADEVWKDIPEAQKNLFNAAIFCINGKFYSLAHLARTTDLDFYFQQAKCIRQHVFSTTLELKGNFGDTLKHSDVYKLAARENWAEGLLQSWDKRALDCLEAYNSSKTTGELAYILAMIGEVLGCMAGGRGGLRSGPASNRDFASALKFIQEEKYKEGLEELKNVRTRWLNQPDRIVRAARHYEGAVQILIRKTVMSAQKQVSINFEDKGNKPELDKWVQVKCPARLDLSGGWTDTPPICYELGGMVVDVAIMLNGEKPIGCKAKRVTDLNITIVVSGDIDEIVVVADLSDMLNYCNPTAKGALIKCCLLASGVVTLEPSAGNLSEQLVGNLGSGLYLITWANLPQGSGLGTSSILAATVLAAIWRCMGVQYTHTDIIHSVLVVEQLLSTGGGWQDQVGGVCPGFNVGTSPQDPFVKVNVKHLEVDSGFLAEFESRLLVVYTGKPRLAKNLLQNVIRNWYCKDQRITQAFKDNYSIAEKCREAVLNKDLKAIGECLNQYFIIKKILAPGSEPALVKEIFEEISGDILGGTLCGAGGGGFLVALVKDPESKAGLQKRMLSLPGGEFIQFYTPQIDTEGLVVED